MLGRCHDRLNQTKEPEEGLLKGEEYFTHEELEDDNTDRKPQCSKDLHKPITTYGGNSVSTPEQGDLSAPIPSRTKHGRRTVREVQTLCSLVEN